MPPREAPAHVPELPAYPPSKAAPRAPRRLRSLGPLGWSLAVHGIVFACVAVSVGAAVAVQPATTIEARIDASVPLEEPERPREIEDPLDYTRTTEEVEPVEIEVPLPPPTFAAPPAETLQAIRDPLASLTRNAPVTRAVSLAVETSAPPAETPETEPTGAGPVSPPQTEADTSPAGPPVVRKPRPLASNEHPTYPSRARRRGWQGTVVLEVHVSAEGAVEDVEVSESSGYSELDRAARRAALDWRYEPATEDGSAVDMWLVQPVSFRM